MPDPYAIALAEVRPRDTAAVGGKAAGLGELIRAGTRVPPGFALTTAAFAEVLAGADPDGGHRAAIARLDPDDLDAVGRVTAELRDHVERAPMPGPVRRAVLAGYRPLEPPGWAPVAVRSSATAEDGTDASFAGLQDTYLWVRGEESVLAHVRRCWASLYNVESVVYRRRHGHPEPAQAMGVVVQRMVDPRCAGVMFTRSPSTGDRSVVVIEAAWGLGSALVSGEVTPDRMVVNKVTGEIVSRVVADKARRHRLHPTGVGVLVEDVPDDRRGARCLSDEETAALVTLARRVEAAFGAPQDIEWAITDDGLYALQSRPETYWSRRDAAPVAPSHPTAFDHILDVLGGRRRGEPGR